MGFYDGLSDIVRTKIPLKSEYESRRKVFDEAKRICENQGSTLMSANEIVKSNLNLTLFE